MAKYGMLIETDRCLGCGICVRACKDEFEGNDYPPFSAAQPRAGYGYGPGQSYGWPQTPSPATPWTSPGHLWMAIEEEVSGCYPDLAVRYLPLPCMQCENAPCVEAAADGAAVERADGIVLIDPEKSRGQRGLVASCPYGRIQWNEAGNIPQKCTFCAHLLERDEQPRCVEACPVEAISFGDLEDPSDKLCGRIEALGARPLQEELGTRPRVYYAGLPGPLDREKPATGRTTAGKPPAPVDQKGRTVAPSRR
jgi:Fe-S-cluster-containing dehydrogenase component